MKKNNEHVFVTQVHSKDFITDLGQQIKNIVGGRLRAYEQLVEKAIRETKEEFKTKYPNGKIETVRFTELTNAAVLVVVEGKK